MADSVQEPAVQTSHRARANETLLEWERLGRSLQKATEHTRSKFCLCLQILALSLLGHYDGSIATELLARDEATLLEIFLDADGYLEPGSFDYDQAHHIIALVRGLLAELGGDEDCLQRRYDVQYSVQENHMIFGAIVDIEGDCSIEDADPEKMHQAVSRSTLLAASGLMVADVVDLMEKCRNVLEREWVYV